MIPSASVRLISVRSASNTVSTKMIRTGPVTCGRARFIAPAVPSWTFCSMKREGILYRARANASTCSFKCPVMKMSSVTSNPLSRSITQSITGRPATLSSGFGVRCVWGRRRVPLPARGMITCMSASSVAVLEAHKIVQLGRRGLEDVAIHHRLDLVDELGWNVHGLARLERPRDERVRRLGPEDELTREDVHRLVLLIVILKTENVARFDVEDLADVSRGASPHQLIAPRFVDPVRDVGHSVLHAGELVRRRTRRANVNTNAAAHTAFAPKHGMTCTVDRQRGIAHGTGIDADATRAPAEGETMLGPELQLGDPVTGPSQRGRAQRSGRAGLGTRHGGACDAGSH